jgi:salicylate hydroxylase
MEIIDPNIVLALRSGGSVSTSNDVDDPNDYLRWIDGYNQHDPSNELEQRLLFKLDAGYKGFEGTRRDQFLENLVKIIPAGIVHFNKRLETMQSVGSEGRVVLSFTDGTVTQADAGEFSLKPD